VKPLEGVLLLDLTHMLSGPYGTMVLTDLGCRTIKIEPPGVGEATRQLLRSDPKNSRQGMGAYYLTLNRGKESVGLDLKTEAGRGVFYDLVRAADIVFDNFSVGVTQRLGIDHDALSAINPRIITCSVTGFGGVGPDIHRPAFDQVVQAAGGGMSITGRGDDGPVRSGIPIGDLGGGVFGALGVLAALHARERTGLGRHVDVSMLDVQISLLNYMATMYLLSGEIPQRIGNGHNVHIPYNTFRTKDGYVVVACIGDAFFKAFRDMLGHPDLMCPEYENQPARFAAKERIEAAINEAFGRETTAYWLARLQEARIPSGPVNDFAQALSDRQVLARDMVVDVTLQNGERIRLPGNPIKFAGDEPSAFGPPPLLGEHTRAVLRDVLSYDEDKIAKLRAQAAIA
jgi:crotonobetainyl-CoA:carnitine CoA-transferase CaiB-like acyl-CoA transferase